MIASNKIESTCKCLFCNSKCPICGSTSICVRLRVEYNYHNDSKNIIYINQDDDFVEIECMACGEFIENDPRLEPLRQALFKSLNLPQGSIEFPIDDHGEIGMKEFKLELNGLQVAPRS